MTRWTKRRKPSVGTRIHLPCRVPQAHAIFTEFISPTAPFFLIARDAFSVLAIMRVSQSVLYLYKGLFFVSVTYNMLSIIALLSA